MIMLIIYCIIILCLSVVDCSVGNEYRGQVDYLEVFGTVEIDDIAQNCIQSLNDNKLCIQELATTMQDSLNRYIDVFKVDVTIPLTDTLQDDTTYASFVILSELDDEDIEDSYNSVLDNLLFVIEFGVLNSMLSQRQSSLYVSVCIKMIHNII